MPRKAPSQVIEHRISMSDYERAQLKEIVAAYNRDKWLENVPNILSGTAVTIASVGAVYVGYQIYDTLRQHWGTIPAEPFKQAVGTVFNIADLLNPFEVESKRKVAEDLYDVGTNLGAEAKRRARNIKKPSWLQPDDDDRSFF